MNHKVVLAYSGGLDTSFCISYLTKEKHMEVHAVCVNTGGFSTKDIVFHDNGYKCCCCSQNIKHQLGLLYQNISLI